MVAGDPEGDADVCPQHNLRPGGPVRTQGTHIISAATKLQQRDIAEEQYSTRAAPEAWHRNDIPSSRPMLFRSRPCRSRDHPERSPAELLQARSNTEPLSRLKEQYSRPDRDKVKCSLSFRIIPRSRGSRSPDGNRFPAEGLEESPLQAHCSRLNASATLSRSNPGGA